MDHEPREADPDPQGRLGSLIERGLDRFRDWLLKPVAQAPQPVLRPCPRCGADLDQQPESLVMRTDVDDFVCQKCGCASGWLGYTQVTP